MPFMWNVVAKEGQIFGNRDLGSACKVTNPYWFSYPGYSEAFCGFVDKGVNSNDHINNPNVTVFEWLAHKPRFRNKIAAFGAWDALPSMMNRNRAGFYINASLEPVTQGRASSRQELLNHLKTETTGFEFSESPDSITFYSALEYLKQNKPKVFYLSLGWTDEAAHAGRYDEYLKSTHLVDQYLGELWKTAQSMPQYRGKTTLIFTTDHGRGAQGGDWKHHGSLAGSDQTWMVFMGPDTPALGERKDAKDVTLSQVAATMASFLGEDYNASCPKAGQPVEDVIKR